MNGIEAACDSFDSTSATATFATGISSGTFDVTLAFREIGGGLDTWAVATSLTNTVDITTVTSAGTTCSFAGGCGLTMSLAGLASDLQVDGNSVDVCGNECVLSVADSTGNDAVCHVPSLTTIYSATNHRISEAGVLQGTWFASNTDQMAVLSDYNNIVDYSDSTASGCFFGMEFKQGHVGVLDEVKFFINNLYDKTPFANNLVFQGSDDGVAWTDLWQIDDVVHEGWNTMNFKEESAPETYAKFRFYGSTTGSCRVGEARFTGIEAINDNASSYACTPTLTVNGVSTSITDVTYDNASTGLLTAINPRFGSVLGGESVTFVGDGFSATAATTVMIDGRSCAVTGQTTNSITCTTMDKPYVPDTPRVEILIDGKGYVATQGLVYRYVSRWSDTETWGGDIPPLEGESISIPKGQHLLVDVASTPKLNAVIVEGSLIFAPDADANHQRTFDAHYVMVNGGYFEAGTADFPYTSKLTITMHSDVASPYLPIYGNKVIGVRFGQIHMVGVERPITWTSLSATADVGATSITLMESVDWQVGEEIVIAPTGYEARNAEKRTIASISGNTLSFDEPLLYKHFSDVETYGSHTIEMRAEVGLLTRNVKY